MPVYLICLERSISRTLNRTHYIGYTKGTVEDRLEVHRSGQGAKFLRCANEIGVSYAVTRVWPEGTPKFEKYLKSFKNAASLCPCCAEKIKAKKAKWTREKRLKRKENDCSVSST